MARTLPIDLEWCRCGYLPQPDGRVRHIIDLDSIGRDLITAGASLCWADLPGNHPAFCHLPSRTILLAPWLAWALPPYLRLVLRHELAHLAMGPSEEQARQWAARHDEALLVTA